MTAYLPQTDSEIRDMLAQIGVDSIDDLFADIPEDVRLKRPLNLAPGLAESDVLATVASLAKKNRPKTLFAGAGQYDHAVPAAVKHLAGRAEFVTAYTPYQPEIAQGYLQVLFEFQSMMAEITGLPISNASLYDGFTAAAEACAMALNARRKSRILLVASTVHPSTRRIIRTHFSDRDVEIRELSESGGRVELSTLAGAVEDAGAELAGVLVQTPNIYGALENLEGWASAVHDAGGRLIVSSHPLSLGVLTPPSEWGADMAVGDTQPLGVPPYFGGPSAGFITCGKSLMRRMPGRIVGESVDCEGKRAFVLTLQAREQHIKRERATSNICTNQSLIALINVIYLALLGPAGFAEASRRCISAAAALREALVDDMGMTDYAPGAVFNEFTVRVPVPRERWDAAFDAVDYLPGVWLSDIDDSYPEDLLTVAVTEKRTAAEIQTYLDCAEEALRGLRGAEPAAVPGEERRGAPRRERREVTA